MKTQPLESTNAIAQGELAVHRFSRWSDKDGRLLVVHGFWYGKDHSKPMSSDFEKTDVELLDVHAQKLNVVSMGRFFHYVIEGKLIPWRDAPLAPQSIF